MSDEAVQSERIVQLEELVRKLTTSLRWMVDNDETNEGSEPVSDLGGRSWDEVNQYWLDGKREAIAALEASDTLVSVEHKEVPTPRAM